MRTAGLRRLLVVPSARAFVDWASAMAGPRVILERSRFRPEDLKPWLGALAILQWDVIASDYRYRLFGTGWAETLGQDLTSRLLAAWPDKIARAIRDRVHGVVVAGRPVGAQVAVARNVGGHVRRGHTVFEQVVWPLSYGCGAPPAGCGAPPAVIALAVPVPEDTGPTVDALRAATGHRGHWFDADGAPLAPIGLTVP